MKTPSSWEPVLRECLSLVMPLEREETVFRGQARHRLLQQAIVADRDYPSGDLSLMDGYAIGEKRSDVYRVEGENRPGFPPGIPWEPGTARRIFTGAELPSGATHVIPQEVTERTGDELRVTEYPQTPFTRLRASEARQGSMILKPKMRLGAVELAILATVGLSQVQVAARPRVAHLVTGNEVVDPDAAAQPGVSIRDSNSDLIAAVLAGIGQTICEHRRVHDEREATARQVRDMAEKSDLLLISGGASVGDHDHARPALEAAGFRFEAHGLNVRPGKPIGLARRGDQWAVALPGNPVSHLVALQLFVLPLLRALEGEANVVPQLILGRLADAVETKIPQRDTFWPAQAALEQGAFQIRPRRFLSSGDLLGVAGANALLFLPATDPIPQKGDTVNFLSLASPFA